MARTFGPEHYRAIAAVIRERRELLFESANPKQVHTELSLLLGITDGIVDMLERDSSKFDEVEFRRACGEVS